jgi:hypothetical protein
MAASMKMAAFWDKAQAVCTSEMSVYFNKTKWHYIPESCHLFRTRYMTSVELMNFMMCSSGTLATTYKFTQHHNQEEHSPHLHCCESLKSHLKGQFCYKSHCQAVDRAVRLKSCIY